MAEHLKLNKDKLVFVVLGWRENYMDVLGCFTDESKAYHFEDEKSDEYGETRVVESFVDEEEF
jgi:hypothetical protein